MHHLADLRGNWENWMDIHFPAVVSAIVDLNHKSASIRKAAVAQLLRSTTPSDEHIRLGGHHVRAVTTALAGRLGDGSAGVREAAVRGLSCITSRSGDGGDRRRLILAMADLAEEETAVTVRRAAVQALARIADRGDSEALAPVLRLLRRSDGHCRGDHFTPHPSPALSRHAARAVGRIAERGDTAALRALYARLAEDPDGAVREAAARSLGSVAEAGDRLAVAALTLGLADRDEPVRRAAMRSLRALLREEQTARDAAAAAAAAAAECETGAAVGDARGGRRRRRAGWSASRLWLLPEACDC
jgi:HEAT repeat protein